MKWMLMPLRRYADFNGRSRRMEFWMWQLFLFLVNMVLFIIAFAVIGGAMFALLRNNPDVFDPEYGYDGSASYGGDVAPDAVLATIGGAGIVIGVLLILWSLFILIPNLAVAIRRLHDTNRTGWWILAPLAPYAVALPLAVMAAAAEPDLAILAAIISLIAVLAVIGLAIMLLVFYFLEGTRGPNRFGPDPKGPSHEETFR